MLEINYSNLDLLNILPDGTIIFDLESKQILFANKVICDTIGYTVDEILQFSIYDLHPITLTEETILKYLGLINNEVHTLSFIPIITKLNRLKYFDVTGNKIFFENKNCFLGIFRATDSIFENQITLNRVNKNILDIKKALDQSAIIAITDSFGKILDVNQKFCELSQYSPHELVGQNHRILNSGFHPKSFFIEFWKCISSGNVWHGEICNKAKDGSIYWVETTITPFIGDTGNPEQYIAIRFDITSKKENEKLLLEKEANLTSIIGSLEDIIFIIDEDYTFLNVWIKDEEVLFIPIDQFINKKQREVFPLEYSNLFEKHIDEALRSDKSVYFEYKSIIPGDNNWFGAHISEVNTSAGEKRKVSLLVKNVTARKEVENKLIKNEKLFRLITENSNDWICLNDIDGNIIYSSPSSVSITGYEPQELIGRNRSEFYHPDDYFRFKDKMFGKDAHLEFWDKIEYRFQKKDGSFVWFETTGKGIYDDQDDLIQFCTATRDISSKVRYSEQLKNAERIAKIGSWELNLNTNELFWSDEIYMIFNIDPNKFSPSYEKFLGSIHPDDKEMVNKAYSDSVAYKTPYNITHRLLLENNEIKYVREQAITIYDASGFAMRSLGTVQDITELHESQLKLEEINNNLERLIVERTESLLKEKWARINSDALKSVAISNYKMLFDQTPLGVLVLEFDVPSQCFIIRDVNPMACLIEDVTKDEIVDKKILEFYPYSNTSGFHNLLKEVYDSGQTLITPPRPFVKKGKDAGWREVFMFKLATNEIVIFYRDVTEKVFIENALKNSLLEKEYLLNEVHHRVKNNLQIIIGLMQMQSFAYSDVPIINNFMKQSENRIKAMGLIHETIYETGQYTGINIVSYIESLFRYLCNAIGKPQIEFKIESQIDAISILNASAFGIVLNEIISNSLKYAFPNNLLGVIDVKITAFSENEIQVLIRDNGIGIQSIPSESNGLGMKLIKGLIKQQKGSVEINTFPSFSYLIKLPTTKKL